MTILITGGTGYIGSHVALMLMDAGQEVVILDNLSNSKIEVVDRLQKITGSRPIFIKGDVTDQELIESILSDMKVDTVMHFAGLKSVAESVLSPLSYYQNNVVGTINLLRAMDIHHVRKFVFSSSATVYGKPHYLPINEEHPTLPESPYGRSKLQIEQILEDLAMADSEWKIIALRYFNPVGAHKSGLIGEDPNGVPNNLMPYIAQVASGILGELKIYGDDYATQDGTGIRDYIHVVDLAKGHLAALRLLNEEKHKFIVVNLGSGHGHSVLEMHKLFQIASSKTIKSKVYPRRPGDIDSSYAEVTRANDILGWRTEFSAKEMCEDTWRWQIAKDSR